MCGIVGIVHRDREHPVEEQLLRKMTDVMRYRGPDDSGLWFGSGVGLGHRRLSIIDIAGGAPAYDDRRFTAVDNL
jgi:asparagine synthase (glutamine-hydrolysing)